MLICVDIGGTTLRVALLTASLQIVTKFTQPTLPHLGPERATQAITSMMAALDKNDLKNIEGIGLSVASPLEGDTGLLIDPPNLPGWSGISLSSMISKEAGLPVKIGNDATLAALAEHRVGAGRGYSNMLYYTLSTGIGGGIVLNGELYKGANGFAGELGHMTVDFNGPRCNCGNVGCLEALASGSALAREARAGITLGESTTLSDENANGPSAIQIFQAAMKGDRFSMRLVNRAARALGAAFVSAAYAFDPHVIIVGGGISLSFEQLKPGIDQYIAVHASSRQNKAILIMLSALGDNASLIGAGCLFPSSWA